MNLTQILFNKRLPLAVWISICFLISVLILVLSDSAIQRSIYVDEAMLFSNYPPEAPVGLLRPLELFDQAAPPLYSLLFGETARLRLEVARGVHLFVNIFLGVLMLSTTGRTGVSCIVAGIVMTMMPIPLYYFSELKHYGLEVSGVFILLNWYFHKDVKSKFGWIDATVLSIGLSTGILTIIITAVVVLLFAVLRMHSGVRWRLVEVMWVLVMTGVILGYYKLVNELSIYQLNNYPRAYGFRGGGGGFQAVEELGCLAFWKSMVFRGCVYVDNGSPCIPQTLWNFQSNDAGICRDCHKHQLSCGAGDLSCVRNTAHRVGFRAV